MASEISASRFLVSGTLRPVIFAISDSISSVNSISNMIFVDWHAGHFAESALIHIFSVTVVIEVSRCFTCFAVGSAGGWLAIPS